MDPLSTEGRLIESASRSGKLLSIRNGTALENIGTGAVYGRTPEGALARVDPEGGDISFLNTNKDMFIPSGITGSVEMLSTELFVEKKDILASKTLKHYLRQTAPYAANFTGSILGAWAGHLGTEGVKHLASGALHLVQHGPHFARTHDIDVSHEVVVLDKSMQHGPIGHDTTHFVPDPHHEADAFDQLNSEHGIGHNDSSRHKEEHCSHHRSRQSGEHSSSSVKHRIGKAISRLAVCDNVETRRFVERQCAIFDERMRTLMDMARVSSPDIPNWPASPNPADIELMARAVVAASNACQEAYAQRVAHGEHLLPLQQIPHLEESFPHGPRLPDGRPLMSPMPSRPPPGLKIPNIFRTQEDFTERERAEANFIMMAAIAGAILGSRTNSPILIGLIAALGAIAAAFAVTGAKQRQEEGTARS